MAVAQTLGLTHGLRDNMRVVVEGTQHSHDFFADNFLSALLY